MLLLVNTSLATHKCDSLLNDSVGQIFLDTSRKRFVLQEYFLTKCQWHSKNVCSYVVSLPTNVSLTLQHRVLYYMVVLVNIPFTFRSSLSYLMVLLANKHATSILFSLLYLSVAKIFPTSSFLLLDHYFGQYSLATSNPCFLTLWLFWSLFHRDFKWWFSYFMNLLVNMSLPLLEFRFLALCNLSFNLFLNT